MDFKRTNLFPAYPARRRDRRDASAWRFKPWVFFVADACMMMADATAFLGAREASVRFLFVSGLFPFHRTEAQSSVELATHCNPFSAPKYFSDVLSRQPLEISGGPNSEGSAVIICLRKT